MTGARDFAQLFETGQYGRLYITSGSHARGRTFHIQVLPDGEKAKGNGKGNLCLNGDAVEVYGIIAGNPGWSEEYGWLHLGKWQKDFGEMVKARRREIDSEAEVRKKAKADQKRAEYRRKERLLAQY